MASSESALPLVGLIFAVILYDRYKSMRKAEKRQALYLKELAMHEGVNFFCYNNRQDAQLFIEEHILPKLPSGTKVVFLQGKQIKSEGSDEFIKTMLMNLRHYKKFPHLCKIRNCRIEDKSINNLFYAVKNKTIGADRLIAEVDAFFSE